MSENRTAVSLLESQFAQARGWFEGTMEGVNTELAHRQPAGKPGPIGAQAGHVVTALDGLIVGAVAGQAPLMASSHAQSTGLSEPPMPGEYEEWSRRVQVDLPALHAYSNAVFDAVEQTLAGLEDADLQRELDLSQVGADKQPASWVFNVMLLNTYSHTGEISALKGLEGLKGYPQ